MSKQSPPADQATGPKAGGSLYRGEIFDRLQRVCRSVMLAGVSTMEFEIIAFLKQNRDVFFNRKEISRKARRRDEYEENPHWASAPLNSLVTQGVVIQNESGHYRLSDKYDD